MPRESEAPTARADVGLELTDSEILATARVHKTIPPGITEPAIGKIAEQMAKGNSAIGFQSRVAIWPDGIWAFLGFNREWDAPRPNQLIRVFRNARAAGCYLKCD